MATEGNSSQYLTRAQACAYLQVSPPTLYAWARRAKVRRVKFGKMVRWPKDELDRMAEASMRVLR